MGNYKNKTTYIAPSILAADPNRIEDEIALIKTSKATFVHIDIMDGKFVRATTFDDDFVKRVIDVSDGLVKDVHIMVEEPWIIGPKFAKMGASIVTFHYEACGDDQVVFKTIEAIRDAGSKVGISIKPNTPVEVLNPFLDQIDLVLIMTVEPGAGGQSFMVDMMEKVKKLSSIDGRKFLIECDGGIKDTTVSIVKEAGADVLVAGSYLFGHKDFKERVEILL